MRLGQSAGSSQALAPNPNAARLTAVVTDDRSFEPHPHQLSTEWLQPRRPGGRALAPCPTPSSLIAPHLPLSQLRRLPSPLACQNLQVS